MIAALLLLSACTSTPPDDSGAECPMLDCRDTLSVTVLAVDGAPSDAFNYRATADGVSISGTCTEPASQPDATCLGDGRVDLYLYGATVELGVDEGDDAPYWSGTLTPAWEAPYDSEQCGHYCYLAEETVQLEPCDGCG